jgi:photosystem II stability/assembly factor-like uncharacterized protein
MAFLFYIRESNSLASYNLIPSALSVDEGMSVSFTLETTGIDTGALIPYTITGISSEDLAAGSLTGNFTIGADGTDTIEFTIAADSLTEGPEVLTLSLDNGQAVAEVTINDTSTSPVIIGTTWTARTSGTTNTLVGSAYSGSIYVLVGASGTILSSPDGITWTARSSGTTNGLNGVYWSGTEFIAVGAGGIMTVSPDGINWTLRNSGTGVTLSTGKFLNGQHILVGVGIIRTSPDGISWTSRTTGTANQLNEVTWTGTQYIVVGHGGVALSSPTGETWSLYSTGSSQVAYGVLWTGSLVVVTQGSGVIRTSPTGNSGTFTARTSGVGVNLFELANTGAQLLTVGNDGTILSSVDGGITWSPQTSGAGTTNLRTITFGGGLGVIGGQSGLIRTSSS